MDSLIKKAIAKQPTIKPRTKRNAQPEAIEQAKVIAWARANENNYPYLWMLHSSLNGVKMTKAQAGRAIAQGMLSGVPDLFLPVPKNGYHGLFIEMKYGSNKVTKNQEKFLQNAANVGYAVSVCYSANEAIKRIEDYYQ
jgi:hypothetical protein